MSNENFLNTVNNYSVKEFVLFLKHNGLSEFENIALIKNVDGHTFLNLAEFEINNWKPLITSYQAQKFWSFLNQLQADPMNFVFIAPNKPPVPRKPTPEKDHLKKLSTNNSFLEALRTAVETRTLRKDPRSNSKSPKRDEVRALPPRPPNHKKPPLPVQKRYEPEPKEDDSELIYESPDDEREIESNPQLISPQVVPKIPIFPPSQKEAPQIEPVEEVQTNKRRPFLLQHHYTKQREKEKELEKSNLTRVPIQSNPLPPVPIVSKEVLQRKAAPVVPRPPKSLPKIGDSLDSASGTLPVKLFRPPKSFPKLDDHATVDNEPSKAVPPSTVPIDKENFYRYTDRKGAEELLSEEFADGTYLIRPSRSYHSTLSVRQGDKVYHIGIKKEGDQMELESCGLNLTFDSLHDIIGHYETNAITVRNKYNEIVEIYLNKTLPPHRT